MAAHRKTVQRKLTELILGTSFCLLAVTSIGLVAYEVHSYRQSTVRSLSMIAEIMAENTAAVVIFDDEKLAQEILGGLRVEPEVAAAGLFDANGKLYATYPKDLPPTALPAVPHRMGSVLGWRDVALWKPVMQGDTRVGTIFFRGNLEGTYQRIGIFGFVLVLTALASGFVAIGLYQFLQRRISEPLASLAASARKITLEKDFSIRAVKTSDDEFGDLTDALNSMLGQIQSSSAALQEQEERFRTLADNMVQLAWMTDGKGQFLWYNKRWHDYTGLNFEASLAHGWDTVHPDHRPRLRRELKACYETATEWQDTFPLLGADGQYRWFLSHAIPIKQADGNVLRWFGTNTDVTELRKVQHDLSHARDEAVAASRAKDEFLARLSHELRTPLSPVLLIVSEASQDESLAPDVRADFETIKKNVELEARLIDDLLDLTAIVRGKLVLHRRRVAINEVVSDALSKITMDAAERKVDVRVELDASNPAVECDPVRVQQAVWNVLKNAVKFSPPGGTVIVTTKVSTMAGTVATTITDEGIGMSGDELYRVFDAFAQGDHAGGGGSHRFGGLGLGLAIAQRVIELHSGRVTATSPGPNKGATFLIELPLSHARRNSETTIDTGGSRSPFANAHSSSGLKVLLVEDHAPTRVTLERLLTRRRFDVTCAGSATEARAAFAQNSFQLLISDIGLPDGSGYELMKAFGAGSSIAGIALTGYGMDGDVARAREAGFSIHLTKPVNVVALDAALGVAIKKLSGAGAGSGVES